MYANLSFSGQSKHNLKNAIEETKRLRLARDEQHKIVQDLRSIIVNPTSALYEVATAQSELGDASKKLEKIQQSVKDKERAIGIDGRMKLDRLMNDDYRTHLVNARALKICVQEKLCQRKFERDRLERSFRRQTDSSGMLMGTFKDYN